MRTSPLRRLFATGTLPRPRPSLAFPWLFAGVLALGALAGEDRGVDAGGGRDPVAACADGSGGAADRGEDTSPEGAATEGEHVELAEPLRLSAIAAGEARIDPERPNRFLEPRPRAPSPARVGLPAPSGDPGFVPRWRRHGFAPSLARAPPLA